MDPAAKSLTKEESTRLQALLISAFPDKASLRGMIVDYLDPNLALVLGNGDLQDDVFGLLVEVEKTHREEELITALLAANPTNEELSQFVLGWAAKRGKVDQVLVAALKKNPSDPLAYQINQVLNQLRSHITVLTHQSAMLAKQVDDEQTAHYRQLTTVQDAHRTELADLQATHRTLIEMEQTGHWATYSEKQKLEADLAQAKAAGAAQLANEHRTRLTEVAQTRATLEQQVEKQKQDCADETKKLGTDITNLKSDLNKLKLALFTIATALAALIASVCLVSMGAGLVSGVAVPWLNLTWGGFGLLILFIVALWALFYYALQRYRGYFVP
jgi:hypothetical protein